MLLKTIIYQPLDSGGNRKRSQIYFGTISSFSFNYFRLGLDCLNLFSDEGPYFRGLDSLIKLLKNSALGQNYFVLILVV